MVEHATTRLCDTLLLLCYHKNRVVGAEGSAMRLCDILHNNTIIRQHDHMTE